MKKKISNGLIFRYLTLLTIPLFVFCGTSSSAIAQGKYYSLLAETMRPIDSSIGFDNTSAFLTTTINSSTGSTSYIGQLNLPDGSSIVSVRGYGKDTDPNQQFYFRLYRYNLSDNPVWSPVTDFAYSGIAFAGGDITIGATVNPANAALVDNQNYSYGIFLVLPKASVGKQLGLLRFVVETTFPINLPIILTK